MCRQLLVIGLLFALGVSIGVMFTPVGMEMMDPVDNVPVHRKPESNQDLKPLHS